ncbi:MAG TPA: glycine betaine ABC transporter substrate-binding protein [Mariniphaga sp.]|nr:glycine betaine ABC transporter substrate-binding protein [Mariniphaga sp.]
MKKISIYKWNYLFLALLLLFSCNTVPSDDDSNNIRLVYTDWSESIGLTYLSKILLEEEMGFTVEIKLTDIASAYNDIAEKKADFFVDAWLPETHKVYLDEHEGKIETIGIIFSDARTGFVVPEYSRLKSITDLNSYSYPIVGIDEGAGVMLKAKKALEINNLDTQLLVLSEEEMISQFEDSIKRRKEIVITGWAPHWIFARYEARFLEDPEFTFGAQENIYTIGYEAIDKIHPRAVRLFERMQLSKNQLNELVFQIQLNDDPLIGVRNWLKNNEHIVNQWLKNLKPERKKIM